VVSGPAAHTLLKSSGSHLTELNLDIKLTDWQSSQCVFVCANTGRIEIMVMVADEIAASNSMIHLAKENIQSPERTVGIYVNVSYRCWHKEENVNLMIYIQQQNYSTGFNIENTRCINSMKPVCVCVFKTVIFCEHFFFHLLPWWIRTAVHTAWDLA